MLHLKFIWSLIKITKTSYSDVHEIPSITWSYLKIYIIICN